MDDRTIVDREQASGELDLEGKVDVEHAPAAEQLLLAGIVFEGGLVLLAIALGWLFARSVWSTITWSANAVLWGVFATLPMVALLVVIERWPVGPLKGLKQLCDQTLVPLFAGCKLWHFAVISILAGLGEELLFRGLIQTALADWLGVWPGILAAGLLFGLAHPLSRTYVAVAAAIGIYLGWLFVVAGNLLAPIIAHALYDFIALVYLSRPTRESPVDQDLS